MTERPRALVVGTGFGLRVHVPALRAAGFDVVGLVGTDLDRTRRRAERVGIPDSFDSFAGANAALDVDLVTIATPPHTHRDLVVEVAAAGKHLICEKPLARDAVEAEEMVAAVETAGVLAVMGNEFRWDPAVDALTESVRAGVIGEVRTINVLRTYPILADPDAGAPAWWFESHLGGGWLAANGSHLIDQIQTWTGGITAVDAVLQRAAHRGDGGADVAYHVQFRTACGATGVLHETAAAWGDPVETTRVVGATGTLWIDGTTCWLADSRGTREVVSSLTVPDVTPVGPDGNRPWTNAELTAYTQLATWVRGALAGVPTDGWPSPASIAEGAQVVRVIDAVRASDHAGGWLDVPAPATTTQATFADHQEVLS
jgi:predicted dehydrogenase